MVNILKKENITKEMADEIMKLRGEIRGIGLKTDMDSLRKKKGKEYLVKMGEELERLGYPLKYNEINIGAFYPIGQDVLDLLVIWKLLDFDKTMIKEIGYDAPNFSIFLKIFLKHFASMKDTLKQARAMEREHYTIGEFKLVELNEEKRYAILRMDDFDIHPIECLVLEGYFAKLCQMMIREGKAVCEETECTFRGGKTHEYLVKW